MLELYHGSNVAIDKIDLSKGHINKDFGKGFYLTTLPQQAMEPQLVEALRYRNLNNQYFFGTERAVAKLTRI